MSENTFVRDELARQRTSLANERTLLSYGRTALGLVGFAVLVFKFSPTPVDIGVGICSLLAAIAVFMWGLHSFRATASKISIEADHTAELAFQEQKSQ